MDDYDYYEDEERYEDEETYENEEEECAEEDKHKPSAEELEYLEFRQRMKEQIRKRRQKEMGSKSSQTKPRPSDNFGSFFGPSQPVIAQRVIQESKPLLENPQIADRVFNGSRSQSNVKREISSSASRKKTEAIPKATKEVQKKVQQLKNTRDYSFLFSENATVPAPSREPKSSSSNRPKPYTDVQAGRSAPVLQKNKQPLVTPRSQIHQPHKDRKLTTASAQTNQKSGPPKSTSSNKALNNDRNPKPVTSKDRIPPTQKPVTIHKNFCAPVAKTSKPGTSIGTSRPVPPPSRNGHESTNKPMFNKTPASSNRAGELKKPMHNGRVNEATRQPMPAKAYKDNRLNKQMPSHVVDHRPKKKPARDYGDDEDARALQEIRRMFNTTRYADVSDDDSDMEANFDEIMREERISSKIGRKEDEEQMRLIEEEERRERARRMAKKRKVTD